MIRSPEAVGPVASQRGRLCLLAGLLLVFAGCPAPDAYDVSDDDDVFGDDDDSSGSDDDDSSGSDDDDSTEPQPLSGLRPYSADGRYWEYRGEPIMPLGVSATDHLFLADGHEVDDLAAHLDAMQALGANYVRNTMSQREPWPLLAFERDAPTEYDLDRFHDDYWQRFSDFLDWTSEREILVQIEVWDRFDFSRDYWELSPWNPSLNVNYSVGESQLDAAYPAHPNQDQQPFFHGVPGHPDYEAAAAARRAAYDLVRGHQEDFVSKMLSYSLGYDHILYVMNNETSTHPSWGSYWIDFIREAAAEQGVEVYCTDMFNDLWDPENSEFLDIQVGDITTYPFLDASQVNSRSLGDGVREHSQHHWDRLSVIVEALSAAPRPINHTKVYDTGYFGQTPDGPVMGLQRMTLDLLGGSASARFHRSDPAFPIEHQTAVRALRMVETSVSFWDVEPQQGLLSGRSEGEAFLAADPGNAYVLFFPEGGEVGVELSDFPDIEFSLEWVELSTATYGTPSTVAGGQVASLEAPGSGPWMATLTR